MAWGTSILFAIHVVITIILIYVMLIISAVSQSMHVDRGLLEIMLLTTPVLIALWTTVTIYNAIDA